MADDDSASWPDDVTYDRLVGDWHIHQRRKGHKTSTDDVLTALVACSWWPQGRPTRYLDLGCGIGSVLLLTAHRLRPAHALGVEAQQVSAMLAKATVDKLTDAPRIDILVGDMRTSLTENHAGCFDLVTGSPPYFPVGTGVLPNDPQRAACRFELRGGVEGYCHAARHALAPEGRFALVFQTAGDERVLAAARDAQLHLCSRLDVRMRADRPLPFLTVYGFSLTPQNTLEQGDLSIRDAEGRITDAYRKARATLGLQTND